VKPRAASSVRSEGVAAKVPLPASWKRRSQAQAKRGGRPVRACRYSGNLVWKLVVKGQRRFRQSARIAIPSGPSVAICTAVGRKASTIPARARAGRSARRISG
jgi:hypothetical protein